MINFPIGLGLNKLLLENEDKHLLVEVVRFLHHSVYLMAHFRIRFFKPILARLGRAAFTADFRHHCNVELFESLPLFNVLVQAQVSEKIVENHTFVFQVALPRVVSLAVNAV
jgi:hypothetical protein